MGLNYKVEKRSFGFDPEKTERYVATAVRGDTVSFELWWSRSRFAADWVSLCVRLSWKR